MFGIGDPVAGEKIIALVEADPSVPVESAGLVKHCQARLSPHKIPRVDFTDEIILTPSGKIARGENRDRYLAARAR